MVVRRTSIVGKLHDPIEDFLDGLYQEEFDANAALDSTQKRPMVPRRKIQASIARKERIELDLSTGAELARTITKPYSGYVHAASPQIMEMYGGNPPHFHVTGMLGTERHVEHRHDLWNYFYRSILSFGLTAKAFADQELLEQIHAFAVKFEETADKNCSPTTSRPHMWRNIYGIISHFLTLHSPLDDNGNT